MPYPLLAHQAPVVLLRALAPRHLCVVALTLGSLGPDLEYLAHAVPQAPGALHKSLGALALVPVITALALLVRFSAGPALLRHLGPSPPEGRGAVRASPGVALSVALGVASHVVLDLLVRDTHFPLVQRAAQRLEQAAQSPAAFELVVTALLSLVTLGALLHRAVRSREALRRVKLAPLTLFTLVALLGATIALARCLFVLREPTLYFHAAKLYAVGYACFHASAGASLALLLTGTALALAAHGPRPRTP